MKKIIFLTCTIILIHSLSAISMTEQPATTQAEKPSLLALTFFTGTRSVSEEIFEQVYGKNNICFGFDVALRLNKKVEIFLHSDLLSTEGETSFTGDKATLTIFPLELGLRIKFKKGSFLPYIGGGAGFYFFKEKSTFDSHVYTSKANPFGYFAETGLQIQVIKKIHVDFKIKFTSFKIDPDEPEATEGQFIYTGERDLKGLTFALGLGVSI